MKKQTKTIIIIVAIVLVAGVIGYFALSGKKNDSTETMSAGGAGGSGSPLNRNVPSSIGDCPDWKAKKAIQKGLTIDPTWIKKHDIDDCTILNWMYHIKYETEWGKSKSGKALFEDAVFEANEANK